MQQITFISPARSHGNLLLLHYVIKVSVNELTQQNKLNTIQ